MEASVLCNRLERLTPGARVFLVGDRQEPQGELEVEWEFEAVSRYPDLYLVPNRLLHRFQMEMKFPSRWSTGEWGD